MDILQRIWPSLDEGKRRLVEDMALALAGVAPQKPAEFLTVAQISETYGFSKATIYSAMESGRLAYKTPNGQARPRYVKVSDFEAWAGMA